MPTSSDTATRTDNRERTFQRILEAARECFNRYSVTRTRIEDIASEAGISRAQLYLHVDGRAGLIHALINDEIARLIEENRKRMPTDAGFAETIIEGSLAAVDLGRSDPLLGELFDATSMESLPTFLLDRDQAPHEMVLSLWKPVFDKARAEGELRDSLSDDDLIEWLMNVHYMLLQRALPVERQRELLELFVVPSLITEKG